jgi:hypothetical protein
LQRLDRAAAALLGLLAANGVNAANDSARGSQQPRWFVHPEQNSWWLSGQVNVIAQMHPAFPAPYTGDNSLRPRSEVASTRVISIFAGVAMTPSTQIWAVAESAGGSGLSHSLGLVGATNADAIRSPELGATPYIARFFLRHVFPLSSESVAQERGPFSLHAREPARRLEILIGKFALPDFLDVNSVGSDDHVQFMNLTAISNAAWQYAGDARGYTYGMLLQYLDRSFAIRFAEAMVPGVPNGTHFDWHVKDAHAENIEYEVRPQLLAGRPGAVRILAFVNHANSGDYVQAVDSFLQGRTPRPLIAATRRPGRVKYGVGANVEQPLTDNLRVFARLGWNDARFESYEVNQSIAVGGDYLGTRWRRSQDKIGLVLLSSGIARNVQSYLRFGGDGILLGDGSLRYGREAIIESYYNARLAPGVFAAVDVQRIQNPGYNRERGPVWVFGLRLHLEL